VTSEQLRNWNTLSRAAALTTVAGPIPVTTMRCLPVIVTGSSTA